MSVAKTELRAIPGVGPSIEKVVGYWRGGTDDTNK